MKKKKKRKLNMGLNPHFKSDKFSDEEDAKLWLESFLIFRKKKSSKIVFNNFED